MYLCMYISIAIGIMFLSNCASIKVPIRPDIVPCASGAKERKNPPTQSKSSNHHKRVLYVLHYRAWFGHSIIQGL